MGRESVFRGAVAGLGIAGPTQEVREDLLTTELPSSVDGADAGEMAILVQEWVEPQVSGVMFTWPGVACGSGSVTMIEATWGIGDVLVCRETDPASTPLFTVAAAVITETGGVLSHAAIVAREVGIPAVLGVEVATTRLAAGAVVHVDGGAGAITLVRRK